MVRLWLFPQTRLGPGPRQRGRQEQGEGNHPLLQRSEAERKGRSAAEVCTSAARKTAGHPLRRARAEPSAKVWLPRFVRIRRTLIQGRVAAGTGRRDGEPEDKRRCIMPALVWSLGKGRSPFPLDALRVRALKWTYEWFEVRNTEVHTASYESDM